MAMGSGLHVTSEIGRLRRVCLHRLGDELLNLTPADLESLLFDDIPFLEEARAEHNAFAAALRAEGAEVVYLEDLVAEVFDAMPQVREAFLDQYLAEAGVSGQILPVLRAYFNALDDNRAFVRKTMAGVTRAEVELPRVSSVTLAGLVSAETESELVVNPMPNLYFTRDPFAVVGEGVSINRMYSATRNRETIYGEYVFRYHPRYRAAPRYYQRNESYHIEGGDVLVLSEKTVAVGISQRTQAAAIDALAQRVFWDPGSPVERILAFNIPVSRAFMHLDTVFTQVDVDAFTIHPAILRTLQVFELMRGGRPGEVRIREINDTLEHVLAAAVGVDAVRLIPCGNGDPVAAAREQWSDGSNTLALAPGKLCVYRRNTATNEALERAGMELVVIPSAELSRGRGGPRCMSMPLVREDL